MWEHNVMMNLLTRRLWPKIRIGGKILSDANREQFEWTKYLEKWIFKKVCPVCRRRLDSRHSAAHVGSCNFNGPNLSNGFLQEVKNREWNKVSEPFVRLESMDMMACEVVRCPDGLSLTVWVEVDLAIGGDQYLVYTELIEEYDLQQIERVIDLKWIPFH